MNIYQRNGFIDRMDYLNYLSEEYAVTLDVVKMIADVYGPTEDFDGLVSDLQDLAYFGDFPEEGY